MGDAEANKSFPDQAQRAAFCYSQFRRHSKDAHMADKDVPLLVPDSLADGLMPENDALPMGTLRSVEVFATGDWSGSRKVMADTAMLDRIVHNFTNLNSKVTGFGVPVKLGHDTKPGDPAMGWMTDLQRVDQTLVADFADVPSAIVDAIGKRRYNSVSIELYPQIKYGGTTFKDVLGGVAFLGSEWPAVKGLKPLSAAKFSEAGGEVVTLTSKEQDMPNDMKFSQDQADALVTAAVTKATADLTAANTDLSTKLTAEKTRADTAEAAVKSFAAEKTKAEFAAVIEGAIKDGRLLDKDRSQLEAVAALFAGQKAKVGDKEMSGLDLFKAHVAGMQPKVKFGEQGKGNIDKDRPGTGAKASDELAEKATAKVAAAGGPSKMSYEIAVDAVLAEDADLKNRYAAGE
jgi:hypothetical protein